VSRSTKLETLECRYVPISTLYSRRMTLARLESAGTGTYLSLLSLGD
jgi:hypothetical protein